MSVMQRNVGAGSVSRIGESGCLFRMVSGRPRLWRNARTKGLSWLFGMGALLWAAATPSPAQAQTAAAELRSGWFPREPYQMSARPGELVAATGLDIQIARELFDEAGYRVAFDALSWAELLNGLRSGDIDFVMGSYYREVREAFAVYSIPYRTEQNAIYYHESVEALDGVRDVDALIEVLRGAPLRIAVTEDYVYGSQELTDFLDDPPASLQLVASTGYADNLALILERRVDVFVSNPLIMDRMLVETGQAEGIRKLRADMGEIPVHIMFSRESLTETELERINAILRAMNERGRIRALHRDFVLPVYLSITTGQAWFVVLNLMGIVAFCTSGVLLARKERYNIFGALVLAILPAIGGGVLRDLFLGADRVFVLETPEYVLVAIGVVVVAFIGFKTYDGLHGSSHEMTRKFDAYAEEKLGDLFGQLFKFFDAWAVAAFTVIGVSVAVEMKSSPLWLWGPAMGVLTASGGVVLRDIVRADFNIEMLKQDSYAEISLVGGVLYTAALMLLPYDMSLELIFYLTMMVIVLLFGVRFFILWKGYTNPFQFGALHTRPEVRLQQFAVREPALWALLTRFYEEDEEGKAAAVPRSVREELHNQFLYTGSGLREALDKVAAEPLNEVTVRTYRNCTARLDIGTAVEDTLFSFMDLTPGFSGEASERVLELQQRIHESLKTQIETAAWAIESGEAQDFTMLEHLTSEHQERFNLLRDKYSAELQEEGDPCLAAVLQTTHKVERIIYLLGDYARLRLQKKEAGAGSASNRRAQQAHLLRS